MAIKIFDRKIRFDTAELKEKRINFHIIQVSVLIGSKERIKKKKGLDILSLREEWNSIFFQRDYRLHYALDRQ